MFIKKTANNYLVVNAHAHHSSTIPSKSLSASIHRNAVALNRLSRGACSYKLVQPLKLDSALKPLIPSTV